MEQRGEAIRISKDQYQKNELQIGNQTIKIQSMIETNNLEQNEETDNLKIWGKVNNKLYENQLNAGIKDYRIRTNIIDAIVSNATKIGISTCLVLNNDLNADDCKNIVDYIVE